jgi:site-specific DNA-methyltransferase (adenine-specific)
MLLDVGFDKNELMITWDEYLEVQDEVWEEEKEVKKAQSTKIKRGDIFLLGKHKLICGNALDPNVAKKLMRKDRADLIDIDPPFNIDLSYKNGVSGNKKKKEYGGTTNDNKTDEEYKLFVKTIMENAMASSNPNAHYLFWCDERFVWLFQILYKELGINSKRLLIWLKNNSSPTPQVAFNKMTEFCVYGITGSPYLNKKINNLHEVINKNITTGNSVHDEVLDQLNILMVKRLPGNQYLHPTQKNPSLHEKALRRCTRPGDIVLDLTAGSGSIMSACEQLKRVAYMCEYEPVFCQVILNRYKKLTGLNPIQLYEEK